MGMGKKRKLPKQIDDETAVRLLHNLYCRAHSPQHGGFIFKEMIGWANLGVYVTTISGVNAYVNPTWDQLKLAKL